MVAWGSPMTSETSQWERPGVAPPLGGIRLVPATVKSTVPWSHGMGVSQAIGEVDCLSIDGHRRFSIGLPASSWNEHTWKSLLDKCLTPKVESNRYNVDLRFVNYPWVKLIFSQNKANFFGPKPRFAQMGLKKIVHAWFEVAFMY